MHVSRSLYMYQEEGRVLSSSTLLGINTAKTHTILAVVASGD
jgi:hypothetical protein